MREDQRSYEQPVMMSCKVHWRNPDENEAENLVWTMEEEEKSYRI